MGTAYNTEMLIKSTLNANPHTTAGPNGLLKAMCTSRGNPCMYAAIRNDCLVRSVFRIPHPGCGCASDAYQWKQCWGQDAANPSRLQSSEPCLSNQANHQEGRFPSPTDLPYHQQAAFHTPAERHTSARNKQAFVLELADAVWMHFYNFLHRPNKS